MLVLLMDAAVMWFLLNIFSDQNWDDEKLKVFGIAIAVSLLGGLAAGLTIAYIGVFPALGMYFLVGAICLWGLASLPFKKAAGAMGIFTGYKIAATLCLLFLVAS